MKWALSIFGASDQSKYISDLVDICWFWWGLALTFCVWFGGGKEVNWSLCTQLSTYVDNIPQLPSGLVCVLATTGDLSHAHAHACTHTHTHTYTHTHTHASDIGANLTGMSILSCYATWLNYTLCCPPDPVFKGIYRGKRAHPSKIKYREEREY